MLAFFGFCTGFVSGFTIALGARKRLIANLSNRSFAWSLRDIRASWGRPSMRRSKAPQYIKDMRKESAKTKPQQRNKPAPEAKRILTSWNIVTSVALILGLWISVAWFVPDLSAEPSALVDVSDPFSSPFIIKNEGNISLRDVNASCHVERIVYERNNQLTNGDQSNYMAPVRLLSSKEPTTVYCKNNMFKLDNPMLSADATLHITYSSSIAPWFMQTKAFRFTTIRQADGNLHWTHRAIEDTNK